MYKHLLIGLLGFLSVGAATAEIYKSRGPGGKVSYSNLPPASNSTPVTVLNARAGQPAAQPRATGDETLAPEVVSAVANVMGMSHLVSSTRDFCAATLPASLKRYSSAALAWQQRNAAVVAKKDRILSTSDRNLMASALNGDMLRLTEDMLRPIRQSGTAEKIKWCDKTIEDVDRGVLDLNGRASIVPLMNYAIR